MRRRLLSLAATVLVATTATTVTVVDHAAKPLEDDQYVLLAMGSDMGPWRPQSVLDGRADAMHLIVVTPSERSASILSFPRDLYVPVRGLGSTRINAALTRGPETAVATVEDLVGIDIDDWMVTGMRAFISGAESFGPVTVDVPQRLRLDDNVLEAGNQDLDGLELLIYTRDRKSRSNGDFGRNRAQAKVLAKFHRQLVESNPTPAELMQHVAAVRRTTVSSIPVARMPMLAELALDVDPDRVFRAQVPGANASRGGASVVVPTSGANSLFADLRDDGMLTP